MTRPRALVAMSGGVDSSVAAALLVESGVDVTGVTLRLWAGHSDSGCCGVSDVEDARRVAAQLDIPHYVFDFTNDFDADVVGPYVDAYAAGRTPNPCVECNRSVKFGRLLQRAGDLGFEALATGHHARVERASDGRYRLARGADAAKDQSYVLAVLTQRELARTLLPVGRLTKADVRARAAGLGLRTAAKPDSQDVCFISRGGRRDFLSARIDPAPGRIVDTDGAVLGAHDGVAGFTVGQRRGLGIAAGERRFVVELDASNATVMIGRRADLRCSELRVCSHTWVSRPPPRGQEVLVQVRAHGTPVTARVDGTIVRFSHPQPRVAPGQLVAFYRGDSVLGSAVVS